jgi:hypothetical protein
MRLSSNLSAWLFFADILIRSKLHFEKIDFEMAAKNRKLLATVKRKYF